VSGAVTLQLWVAQVSIKKKISVDGVVKSAIKKIGCTVDEKTFD
jgi:hypothetical protein